MAKQKHGLLGAFALELIGSIVYLYVVVVFSALSMGGASSVIGGGIWQPVLVGISVVGAISLFFASFANISGAKYVSFAAKGSVITGFALAALTFGNGTLFLISIVGFILSFLGSGLSA